MCRLFAPSSRLGAHTYVHLHLTHVRHSPRVSNHECTLLVPHAPCTLAITRLLRRLAAAKVSSINVFHELPIKLHNSNVVMALLLELEEDEETVIETQAVSFELNSGPYIEKHVELLIDCMDDLSNESYKLQFYERNVQRQKLMQQQAIAAKRKPDGSQRTQQEIEEEFAGNPAFKPIQPPSRLDSLLVANQISHYCEQVNKLSAQSLGKLYLLSNIGSETPAEAK